MEVLIETKEELDLKDWFRENFSKEELEEFYVKCVIGSQSVHNVFLKLLTDGYDISEVTVSSVICTIREIHSEKVCTNK